MNLPNKENIIILWLSDIHYRYYDEKKNGELKGKQRRFIDIFLNEVKEILEEKARIDYVILSGDIAFSGDAKTYKLFWDEFIDPFYLLVSSKKVFPKILTIPGNHDVNWDDAGFMAEYLKNSSPDQKNIFLSKKISNFENLFASYSASFSNESIEKDRPSFKLVALEKDYTEIDGALNPYPEKRLFGFYIDKPNNILFILINTAWYSLGSKFDKVIAEHFLNNTNYDVTPASLVENILDGKNQLIEYNGQIIGRDLLRSLDPINYLDKNSGLLVVTCMHHPKNWMAWDELYSINEHGLIINELLDRTDVLLTGHEHVPETVEPETINKTIHFKAGVFLEDNINKENEKIFIHNRFSVLEIGNTFSHSYIKEIRYLYDNGKKNWIKKESDNRMPLRRRSIKFNIPALNSELGSKLGKFRLNDYIFEELLHQKKNNSKPKQNKQKEKSISICGYKCKYTTTIVNNAPRIYICPLEIKISFFEIMSEQPKELLKALKKVPGENGTFLFCAFLVPDILVNWDMAQGYNIDPYEQILNKLTKYGDAQFNKFRDAFFKGHSDNEFKEIMNMRFVNHIIPYWKLERYS